MNMLSKYGAGLMIGAALIIIIPEGVMVVVNSYIREKSQEAAA